jgi:outer membrane protein assembly factor BamB/serine/threonine protein kinase
MGEERVPDIAAVESPPRKSLDYNQLRRDQDLIGDGGQGVVHRVELPDSTSLDSVAVKEPAPDSRTVDPRSFLEKAERWETVDRREREKPLWDSYEYIVGVIDTGDNLPWIAMEYMDGGSLADRLEANPDGLPVNEALWIGECVCRGVEVAHNYGIAHLDLKPANILFRETPDGIWDVPKIGDWGLSRILVEQADTMDELSVKYAAPEQFEPSESGDPDKLTDVYQAGALVYAMLTGDPPYTGGQASIMHDVVYGGNPDPPSVARGGLADALDEAVLIALEAEKTDRYRNIETFGQALQAVRTDRLLPPIVRRRLEGSATSDIDSGAIDQLSTDTEPTKSTAGASKELHPSTQTTYFQAVEEAVSACERYETYSKTEISTIETLTRTADKCLQEVRTTIGNHTVSEGYQAVTPILYDTDIVINRLQSELETLAQYSCPNAEMESIIESAIAQTETRIENELASAFDKMESMYDMDVRRVLRSGTHGMRSVNEVVANKLNESLEPSPTEHHPKDAEQSETHDHGPETEDDNDTDTLSSEHGIVLKASGDRAQIKTELATGGRFYLSGVESDINAGDEVELLYTGTNPAADDITTVQSVEDTNTSSDADTVTKTTSTDGSETIRWGTGIVLEASGDTVSIKTELASGGVFYLSECEVDLDVAQKVYLYCQGDDPGVDDILDIRRANDLKDPEPSELDMCHSWATGLVRKAPGNHAQIETNLANDGVFYLSGVEADIATGDEVELQYLGKDPTAEDIISVRKADVGSTQAATEWPMFQGGPARTGHRSQASGPQHNVTVQWTFETDGSVKSSPAVVDDTVYVGSTDNRVYALDATDGTVQWGSPTDDSVFSSPAVVDDTVYVGSTDGSVYALDTVDGSIRWTFETDDGVSFDSSVHSSPAVVNDTLYAGSDGRTVYALETGSTIRYDGKVTWACGSSSGPVRSSPAVADSTVYVGSNDNSVYALTYGGGKKWDHETGGTVYSTPAVIDNTVYVGSDDTNVYALDVADGDVHWSVETGAAVRSSPAVANGIVYVGSWDRSVYALDAADGTEHWTFETGGLIESPPTVVDHTVYIGSHDGCVYALDAIDGSKQWNMEIGGEVYSSPAVANGTVYIGNNDGTVYALSED